MTTPISTDSDHSAPLSLPSPILLHLQFTNQETPALRMACQVQGPKGCLQNEGEIFNPPYFLSLFIAVLTCCSFLVW